MASSKQKARHPGQRQLNDFANGLLSPEMQSIVERHIEKCSKCVLALETMGGDTLGSRLRHIATQFDDVVPGADDDDLIPEQLKDHSRYDILEKIGAGGMGDVFHARQRSMDRPVAIKVLRRHLFQNDRAVARFQNEIKVAARLNHPNIVHSYDAEVTSGLNILVMELVKGDKLSDFVNDRPPMPPAEVALIGREISEGLDYAHSQGMIHRDIKPQNVMVMQNHAIKITDFGLAKFFRDSVDGNERTLTFEGETFGTPDYIAPEQIRDSSSADCRSDIYSLGCTMYFMLTGQTPFAGSSVGEKLACHLEKEPPPIEALRPEVPTDLISIVKRMMEKDPDRRFQSHRQVMEALAPIADAASKAGAAVPGMSATESNIETGLELSPVTNSPSNPRRLDRRIWIGLGAGGLLAVALLLVSGVVPNPFGATSSQIGETRIAIVIPAEQAWHPEVNRFYQFFSQRTDVEIEFIADRAGLVTFMGQADENCDPKTVTVARTVADISAREFDAVIFTGGWNGIDGTPTRYAFDRSLNKQAKRLIEAMLKKGKPVGAVCGGTAVLAQAGILKGRNAASCRYLPPELITNSEANWTPIPDEDSLGVVVVDGLLVTGGNFVNCVEIAENLLNIVSRN